MWLFYILCNIPSIILKYTFIFRICYHNVNSMYLNVTHYFYKTNFMLSLETHYFSYHSFNLSPILSKSPFGQMYKCILYYIYLLSFSCDYSTYYIIYHVLIWTTISYLKCVITIFSDRYSLFLLDKLPVIPRDSLFQLPYIFHHKVDLCIIRSFGIIASIIVCVYSLR